MRNFKLMLDTDKLPPTNKRVYLYFEWKPEIIFTQSELVIIHRDIYHPKSERLYSPLKRGLPEITSLEVIRDLGKIKSTCELCRR